MTRDIDIVIQVSSADAHRLSQLFRDARSEVQLADTPPEMGREMLLQRSGAERLKMGCSMFATARALVVASVLEKEPSASPARVRRGHGWQEPTQEDDLV